MEEIMLAPEPAVFEACNFGIGTQLQFVVKDVPKNWRVDARILSKRISEDRLTIEYHISDEAYPCLRVEKRSGIRTTVWTAVGVMGSFSLKEITFHDVTLNLEEESDVPFYQGFDLRQVMEDYERSLINLALKQTNNRQCKAAELLGIKPTTLNSKIRYSKLKVAL